MHLHSTINFIQHMSMMFLNAFDPSGLGIYSKTAKNIVERMPVLSKKRRHSERYKTSLHQEQQQDQQTPEIKQDIIKKPKHPPQKKGSHKIVEPFTKSLSREQKTISSGGINKTPGVGSYNPKQMLKQPKMVWNIIGAYQKTLINRKQILQRKQKVDRKNISKTVKKQTKQETQKIQNELNQQSELSKQNPEQQQFQDQKEYQQGTEKLDNSNQMNNLRYRNCSSFVDMNRMLGRASNIYTQPERFNTIQSDNPNPFLTSSGFSASCKKGTVQFKKQLSRQKVSCLLKPIINLYYDCNYDLVMANNKIGPNFNKMINRDGESIDTELHNKQIPNYSQIWLNRNKSSLPNLQLVLQRKIRQQKSKRIKTEQDRLQ